jgi:hypothetical protein
VGLTLTGVASSTASADEPDPFFGVVSQRTLKHEEFDQMREGRIGSFRQPIDWGTVEKNADGKMDWDSTDWLVETTARRDIDLMITLYGSPQRLNENWRTFPIVNSHQIAKYRSYLTEIVSRYGTDGTFWVDNPDLPYRPVTSWQIWNEPNIKFFARPVSASRFAKLVRISSRTITAVDPEATIVLGGLYGRPPDGKGVPAGEFLDRAYHQFGFRDSFDVVGVHPYAVTGRQSFGRTLPVRKTMVRHGDRHKTMEITELGWGSDSATAFGMGTEMAQARELKSAYRIFIANRRRLKLKGIYWFSWADATKELQVCAFCARTGFFTVHGVAKPSWFEMLNFSKGL